MSAFQILKSQVLKARKSGEKAASSVGLVLIGEIETEIKRNGSEPTDEMVMAKAKKLIQSNGEMLVHTIDQEKRDVILTENQFLETLLPQQLSEDALRSIIKNTGLTAIGPIMGHLKKHHNGQFDGKMASKIAKEVN
jgi:hypothetical protein